MDFDNLDIQNLIAEYLDDVNFFIAGEIDEYYAEKKLARRRSLDANIQKLQLLNQDGRYNTLLEKAELTKHVDEETETMRILEKLIDTISYFKLVKHDMNYTSKI